MRLNAHKELVTIEAGPVTLDGMLELPDHAIGIVLFAHGSGSSRLSPRNNFVAAQLRQAAMATLLLDLLTQEEEQRREARFDIGLLSDRLSAVIERLARQHDTQALPIALFGASTGAAAALRAAAMHGAQIAAVVSRGGRPDLAGKAVLEQVRAPTLLIVGSLDDTVLALNRSALDSLHCEKRLDIVQGASHLFEEPGTLETVASLAAAWLHDQLAKRASEQGQSHAH